MSYLLDTHTLLWAIQETEKLSSKVIELLESPQSTVVASVINYWEICIKVERAKLQLQGFLPEDVPDLVQRMGFFSVELSPSDASTFHNLRLNHHRDPFDRMLIWQALNNDLTLITSDSSIQKYQEIGLKTLW